MTVRFSRAAYDELVAHGREGEPREVCGVLGGSNGTDREVHEVRRVENVAGRPHSRYELDASGQYEAMSAIERNGREVVGFYHSHPHGPPRPSGTDRTEARWEGYAYVIVALGGPPFVGAWQLTGEGFEPEPVTVDGVG